MHVLKDSCGRKISELRGPVNAIVSHKQRNAGENNDASINFQ